MRILIPVCLAALLGCSREAVPTDEALIADFHRCQPQYQAALAAIRQRPLIRRVEASKAGELQFEPVGVPEARARPIRDVFACARLTSIRAGSNHVAFDAHVSGLSIGGTLKGMTYSDDPPEKIIRSTDDELAQGREAQRYAYGDRPVEDDWYVSLSAN
ncbi:hypothetical protein [Phenylobacterium sp.]|uniref:hypothetical protein n=1 Tax=Phenylobacterium sp. TaxID=1871053 RepID=UPI003BAB36E4